MGVEIVGKQGMQRVVRCLICFAFLASGMALGKSMAISDELADDLAIVSQSLDMVPGNISGLLDQGVDIHLHVTPPPESKQLKGPQDNDKMPIAVLPAMRLHLSHDLGAGLRLRNMTWLGASSLNGIVSEDFRFRYFSIGTGVGAVQSFRGHQATVFFGHQRNQSRVRGNIVFDDLRSGMDLDGEVSSVIGGYKWSGLPVRAELALFRRRGLTRFQLSPEGSVFEDYQNYDDLHRQYLIGWDRRLWSLNLALLDYPGNRFLKLTFEHKII